MRHLLTIIHTAAALCVSAQARLPYMDATRPVEERVEDLLGRMTIEEKVGQLQCAMAWDYYDIRGRKVYPSESFKRDLREKNIGMLWATFRADPWTKKTLDNGLRPEMAAKAANALQRYAIEHTRLGIPLFLAEEAPHGHMAIGTTVLPTGLGMAATWDTTLMAQAGEVIAREIRLQGAHVSYGPVVDLARDPRWSRVEESMGEDPVLTAEMGAAMVRGMGGGRLAQPFATVVTPKHFIGYGTTEGGANGAPTFIGTRELWENFLPPFKKMIDAGALSLMTSYNSMDGIPCTGNRYLLTDVLRGQWHFNGFVVSDLYSINGMHNTHHVTHTLKDAAVLAIQAGVDVDLGALAYAQLPQALRDGQTGMETIDQAVRRVLRMKFAMGLFEHPYVDPEAARRGVRTAEHVSLARKMAQESVTLLKNDQSLLPLDKGVRVAVVGPTAHNRYNLLGDYTAPQAECDVPTIYEALTARLSAAQVEYAKGCAVRDTAGSDIQGAVAAATRADVVIAVVGGSSARDFKTSYQETGAADTGQPTVSDMDCGEGYDRATLSLLGHQERLLRALKETGKPLIVVYIEGRPLDKLWAADHADALLTAYYPGQEGAHAIADVLFGDYNPAGRLPVSVPRHVGQLPVYYNKKTAPSHDYVEMTSRPLYPFGYGLSYTTFEYSRLNVTAKGPYQYVVTADITNTGGRDGEEVVQLYLHDQVASTVQPVRQLRHFARIPLRKGETRQVTFTLTKDDFSVIGHDMKPRVEPGAFDLLLGASSDDIRLQATLQIE